VDWAHAFSDVLPPLMHDPVTFAVPFFLLLLIIEWGRGAQAGPHRGPSRRLPGRTCGPTRGPVSGWAWCRSGPAGVLNGIALLGYAALLRLRRSLAPSGQPVVHVGDRHCRRRPPLLRLSPDGTPGSADLGHSSGPSLEPVLQLRHRTAAEVEHQWRRLPARATAALRCSAVDGVSPASRSTSSTSSGSTPSASESSGVQSNSSSIRRRTTGCTTSMDQQYLDKNYGGIFILWDRLLRQLPGRDHATALRPHQTGGDLQHLEAADPRVRGDRPRCAPRDALVGSARLHLRSTGMGAGRTSTCCRGTCGGSSHISRRSAPQYFTGTGGRRAPAR